MPPPPLVPPDKAPALLAEPKLNRRTLVKLLGGAGLAVAGGAWIYRTIWKLGPAAPGRVCLTEHEYAINERIAEAFFPGPPNVPIAARDIDLAAFADRYIGGLYDDTIRLFKFLFRALNLSPVLDRGRSFYWLPLASRQEVLEEWADSPMTARRAGYESMRFIYSLGYFEDEKVRAAMGLRFGCASIEGRPPPSADPESPPEISLDQGS